MIPQFATFKGRNEKAFGYGPKNRDGEEKEKEATTLTHWRNGHWPYAKMRTNGVLIWGFSLPRSQTIHFYPMDKRNVMLRRFLVHVLTATQANWNSLARTCNYWNALRYFSPVLSCTNLLYPLFFDVLGCTSSRACIHNYGSVKKLSRPWSLPSIITPFGSQFPF